MSLRVVYIQNTGPAAYPPLEHSAGIFASRGASVTFLGVRAEGAANTFSFSRPDIARVHLLRQWRRNRFTRVLGYAAFLGWATARALLESPRIIYISDPRATPVGVLLTRLTKALIIYHEHDSPGPAKDLIGKFVMRSRQSMAHRALFCVLPGPQRAAYFKETLSGAAKVLTVLNCPSLNEVRPTPVPVAEGTPIRLCYHGSLVPARLPLALLHAMAAFPQGIDLQIAGYETNGHPGYMEKFMAEAEVLGIRHRVDYLGSLETRADILAACSRCHVGLAFMPPTSTDVNEKSMAGASNKVFDYLACGLAVLVSDLPDYRELLVDSGLAVACDSNDPASIAQALRCMLEKSAQINGMAERGRHRIIEEWNYEKQFQPVLDALADSTGRRIA